MPRYRNLGTSIFVSCLAVTLVLSGGFIVWGVPPLLAFLAVLNITTFSLFGWDKFQAKKSRQRIPENCLHGLALIGGSLGSIAGQRCFHHKRSKTSFMRWYWGIVAFQAIVLIAYVLSR